jgi:hypothetical protein
VHEKLPFWFKDEEDLLPFTTLKTDLKEKIIKMPHEPPTVIYSTIPTPLYF